MPTALRGHASDRDPGSACCTWARCAGKMDSMTPRLPKRKTCKRYNIAGHAHALNFSCFRGQKLLCKERACQWLIDAIDRARDKHLYHVWAYVIMPEHAHLLLWPTRPVYDISEVLNAIKQSVSKRALRFVQREAPAFLKRLEDRQPNGAVHYRFWQRGGGFDRNVIEPAVVYHEIDYIHMNPVRRGLCERGEDWPWSSAAAYAGVRRGPLNLDRDSLPVFREETR